MQSVIFRFIYLLEGFLSVFFVYLGICGAKLKYSGRKTTASIIGIVISETVVTMYTGIMSWALMLSLVSLLNIFYFKEEKKRWIILYIPIYIFTIVLRTISYSLYCYVLGLDTVRNDFDSAVVGFPVMIILISICMLHRPILDCRRYHWKQYVFLYLESFGMFFTLALAQTFFIKGLKIETQTKVGRFLYVSVLCACFLLCFLSLYVGLLEKHARESRDKVEQQEFLMEMQQEQIATIEKSENNMRAFKHDLVAHLNALSALVDAGDLEKVKDYCSKLIGDSDSFKKVSYTGNAAIDGVLHRFEELAKERNIDFTIKMVVPREKAISDYDLCILISNILKNALEANENGGHIEIATWPFNQNLCILQSNTTDYPLNYEGGRLVSRKKERDHGFGMRNIQMIIDKYDGSFEIKEEDGLIKVEALV